MLHFLPAPLRGLLAGLMLALNTLICCWPLFAVALLKLLLPIPPIQRGLRFVMHGIAEFWISTNKFWMKLVGQTHWDVEGLSGFDKQHSYLVTSNHQSWVDILVLQRVFSNRIPLLKFFLKFELLYVPVMGLAWWALDFPFMRRKGGQSVAKDIETARKACEKFRLIPTSVISFVEGTRFTPGKHAQQRSPYQHLLKPKTGGLAMALQSLGICSSTWLHQTISK